MRAPLMTSGPGWHPMVVHFPLALVVTAALVMTGYRGGQNVYEYGVGVHHF